MKSVNNLTKNTLQIVPKHTVKSLQTVDQTSLKPKILVNVTCVKNTPSLLNRHGNTFQEMITTLSYQGMMVTLSATEQPGAIKNIDSAATQQSTTAKTPLYNPLNRHGNTFQGMTTTSSATKPGAIKNIYSAATQQSTTAKTPLDKPLNHHGNTFDDGHLIARLASNPASLSVLI